jgi:EmrB/QacA subfamily drug resistance transporter
VAVRRWQLLPVILLGTFLGAIDATLVNVAFPDLLRSFPRTGLAELAWVVNGYTVAFTAALLPAGGLADRFGRRRVYLAGLALFTASALLCAVAPTPLLLVAARVLQGVGGGIITPLALTLAMRHAPEARRGSAIGLWSATQSVAIATAPSLGGVIVSAWGWRMVFLLHLPLGLAALLGALRVVPADPPEPGSRRLPDLAGVGLLVGAIGLMAVAIVQSHAWGAVSWPTGATLATAVALGAWLARRSLRHPNPMVDLGLLRARTTRRANLTMLMLGLVMFALQLANVLFLTGVWGYTEARTGLAITPGPVTQAFSALLGGRLCNRLGQRAAALPGALLLAGGTLTLALATSGHADYGRVFLPALLATSAAIGLLVTALSAAAVAEVPPGRLATGTSLSVTSRAIGATVGLSLLALALSGMPPDAAGSYHRLWGAMAAVAAVLAVGTLGLPGRRSPLPTGVPAGAAVTDPRQTRPS